MLSLLNKKYLKKNNKFVYVSQTNTIFIFKQNTTKREKCILVFNYNFCFFYTFGIKQVKIRTLL